MELYKLFSPRRLLIRAIRDSFASADLILFDANLPAETLAAIARKAVDLGKPLAAIAISPAKVVRLKPCLADIDYLFLNQSEAAALTGSRPDDPLQWVSQLQALVSRVASSREGSSLSSPLTAASPLPWSRQLWTTSPTSPAPAICWRPGCFRR